MSLILLDVRELAARLDVSPGTVQHWERLGRIPCIRTGRRVVYNLDEVVRALRREAEGEPATAGVIEAN